MKEGEPLEDERKKEKRPPAILTKPKEKGAALSPSSEFLSQDYVGSPPVQARQHARAHARPLRRLWGPVWAFGIAAAAHGRPWPGTQQAGCWQPCSHCQALLHAGLLRAEEGVALSQRQARAHQQALLGIHG